MAERTWADIIREQGEREARKQDRRLEELRARKAEHVASFATMGDEELLLRFATYSRDGSYDPREQQLWHELGESARLELLKRLSRK